MAGQEHLSQALLILRLMERMVKFVNESMEVKTVTSAPVSG